MIRGIRERTGFLNSVVLVSLFSFFWVVFSADLAMAQTEVTIPAGTIVSLGVQTDISPEYYKIGDRVDLYVVYDVVVDGKVVIRAGTPVTAEITESQKRGIVGKPAKIAISIRRVEAVDGTMISLYGAKISEGKNKFGESVVIAILCCILGLLIKGGEATVPAGAEIQAEVGGSMKVTVE